MKVHLRNDVLNGLADVNVVITVETRMDSSLERHLSGSKLGSFDDSLLNVSEREHVRSPPEI